MPSPARPFGSECYAVIPKLGAKLIAILALAALVVFLLIWGPAACRSFFTAKKQVEVSQGQAGATVDSNAEAMNTMSNVAAADATADQIHKEGINAIRTAPEGQRGAATVDASCKLRLYANSKRCARLRAAHPGEPAPAR